MSKQNKNGESVLSPQQAEFLFAYTNPKSPTFGNALRSGLKAGYSQSYSENITNDLPTWLEEHLADSMLVKKAEKMLNKTLDYEAQGDDGKIDTALLSIQNNTAKFVAERLNKARYAAKTETDITTNGEAIQPLLVKFITGEQDS